jgi:hypothetical protein
MANTHFSGPVLYSGTNTAAPLAGMAEMPISINPAYFQIVDDFVGVAIDTTNNWTVVKDSSATVAIVADTVGGEVALTSAATTDNDGASIQGNEIFLPASGKNMYFQTRVKNSKVAQSDLCFGFTVNFATNPENMLTAADRIVFQVDDGDASILCKTEASGTETSTDSGIDMVDDTYIVLAIAVEGTGTVRFYINGQNVATHTTNIPATELTVAAMSLSGDALGTRATTLDYIVAAETR